jgi:hypothetical protein
MRSTYAEVQEWNVNLDEGTAFPEETWGRPKRIQVGEQRESWKREEAEKVAKKIAACIIAGKKHKCIKWQTTNHVSIFAARIIPDYEDLVALTKKTRRQRLYAALDKYLVPLGWKRGKDVYRKEKEHHS